MTLPTNISGTYYILACANGNGTLTESNTSNNCTASASFGVALADLIESSVSVLTTTPVAGGSLQVSDTTTNQGVGNAVPSTTGFYLSTNGTTLGTVLTYRQVSALASGQSSGPVTTTLTLPSNISGTYYVIACANYAGTVTESNTANNCTASALFTLAAADLIESSVSVLTTTPVSGGTLQVSDTVTNQGAGSAIASGSSAFYLSTNGTTKGAALTLNRPVPALTPGQSSGPVTTTLTLPSNLGGTYYVIACANYSSTVVESNTANNCTASASFTVAAADLVESSVSVLTTTPVAGGSLQVSDTTTNQGVGNAVPSTTGFYLSTNGTTKGAVLSPYRQVPALASAQSSGPVTTTLTLPSNISGTYYIIACANYAGTVTESNTANNCTASASFTLAAADLIESSVSVLTTTPVSGGTLQVSDTVTNQGAGSAIASGSAFYLSTNGTTKGAALTLNRQVPALTPGQSSGPVTTTLTLPSNLGGTYYVIACANYSSTVVESNTANNCTASASFTVAAADLVESSVSVLTTTPVAGGSLQVNDTTTNQGVGNAVPSTTGSISPPTEPRWGQC